MGLPGIDGWEMTTRLKASPATKTIPIIALTAHAMAGDREKALATSCDDFDTKPIELPRLVAKIDGLLGTKGYRRQCAAYGSIPSCRQSSRGGQSESGTRPSPVNGGRSIGSVPEARTTSTYSPERRPYDSRMCVVRSTNQRSGT